MAPNPIPAYIYGALAMIGAYKQCRATLYMFGGINRHILRNTSPNLAKYNKGDSWAVVTGGSDGKGFEICLQLAQAGLNICIISRTTKGDRTQVA